MTRELVEIQRSLRELIVAPSGVAAALDERGDSARRALEATVRSDAKLSAAERLDIYANAYFYRIHDALCEDYAALRGSLGQDRFHNLVTAYLIAHPPRHPSLRHAGRQLADFLAGADSLRSVREQSPWAADLARLEWAILDAFDSADVDAITRDELAALAPDRWESLRLEFQPALQLLDLGWPVAGMRSAFDRDQQPPQPPQPLAALRSRVLVWRHEERVSYRTLGTAEADSISLALAGHSFGELCEDLAQSEGDDEAPRLAAALLARWQADGLIRRLSEGPPDQP